MRRRHSPEVSSRTSPAAWQYSRLTFALLTAALSLVAWQAGFRGERVPGLWQFNLAVHEAGHMLARFVSDGVFYFLAGTLAQILLPLALAVIAR